MKSFLQKSKIGKTNLEVTQIGMGGAPLGRSTVSTSYETLETAFKKGITYFDTAPHYGAGQSEKFYGNFLSTIDRDSFILSSYTKFDKINYMTYNNILNRVSQSMTHNQSMESYMNSLY